MSQPKRYDHCDHCDCYGMLINNEGEWVKWDDYAALAAENERLRSASFVTAVPSEEYERLKAENEVLRKKVDWLMKAERLVIWNGTKWQVRHELDGKTISQ